ncbi:unnamed protein product [Bursaphelenchus xylophilus]|uniref:(pine wood nematode) hypothetical protein n=1 Tax=Bursaphelenchus xylophilus TaxID=6326 RepID=A0A1I7RQH5_BURXY|nr:unnamed protein product [Bursaphelenchus xylophilus]CAG9104595.1 unnamed protein product [Bursaphelenchus xylophilus]
MNTSSYSNFSNGSGRAPDECALYVRFPTQGVREQVIWKLFNQFGGVQKVVARPHQEFAFVIYDKPEYALYAAKLFNNIPFLNGKLVATPRDRTENNRKFRRWQDRNGDSYSFHRGTTYKDLQELDFNSMEVPGTSEVALDDSLDSSRSSHAMHTTINTTMNTINTSMTSEGEIKNDTIYIDESDEIIVLDETHDEDEDDAVEDTKALSRQSIQEDGELESDDDVVVASNKDEEEDEPSAKRRRW